MREQDWPHNLHYLPEQSYKGCLYLYLLAGVDPSSLIGQVGAQHEGNL